MDTQEKINEELSQMQETLLELKTATEQISRTEFAAKKVVETVESLLTAYIAHLKEISNLHQTSISEFTTKNQMQIENLLKKVESGKTGIPSEFSAKIDDFTKILQLQIDTNKTFLTSLQENSDKQTQSFLQILKTNTEELNKFLLQIQQQVQGNELRFQQIIETTLAESRRQINDLTTLNQKQTDTINRLSLQTAKLTEVLEKANLTDRLNHLDTNIYSIFQQEQVVLNEQKSLTSQMQDAEILKKVGTANSRITFLQIFVFFMFLIIVFLGVDVFLKYFPNLFRF